MKKNKMSEKEKKMYKVLEAFSKGKKTRKQVEEELNISYRHVNRLIIKYNTLGKDGFIHGNKGKQPVNTFSKEKEDFIFSIDSKNDFFAKDLKAYLKEKYDIEVSISKIYNIRRKNGKKRIKKG